MSSDSPRVNPPTDADSTSQKAKPEALEQVIDGAIVSIVFVLSDESGEVLDLATQDAPMRYMHGRNAILKGLERALDGRKVGERFHAVVEAQDAYGLREGEPQAVPKSIFPEGTIFKEGAGMMAKSADGTPFPLWIVRIEEDNVFVDGNHPHAGKRLHFDIEIVAIRCATADELSDGRAHDGCELCRD